MFSRYNSPICFHFGQDTFLRPVRNRVHQFPALLHRTHDLRHRHLFHLLLQTQQGGGDVLAGARVRAAGTGTLGHQRGMCDAQAHVIAPGALHHAVGADYLLADAAGEMAHLRNCAEINRTFQACPACPELRWKILLPERLGIRLLKADRQGELHHSAKNEVHR